VIGLKGNDLQFGFREEWQRSEDDKAEFTGGGEEKVSGTYRTFDSNQRRCIYSDWTSST